MITKFTLRRFHGWNASLATDEQKKALKEILDKATEYISEDKLQRIVEDPVVLVFEEKDTDDSANAVDLYFCLEVYGISCLLPNDSILRNNTIHSQFFLFVVDEVKKAMDIIGTVTEVRACTSYYSETNSTNFFEPQTEHQTVWDAENDVCHETY